MGIHDLTVEKTLRRWLASVWGPADLSWTEWAKGGQAGAPDVTMFAGEWSLPVELKGFGWGERWKLRPTQCRWHRNRAQRGSRSAFLVGLGVGYRFDLFAAPGAVWRGFSAMSSSMVNLRFVTEVRKGEAQPGDRDKLLALLRDNSNFWDVDLYDLPKRTVLPGGATIET